MRTIYENAGGHHEYFVILSTVDNTPLSSMISAFSYTVQVTTRNVYACAKLCIICVDSSVELMPVKYIMPAAYKALSLEKTK